MPAGPLGSGFGGPALSTRCAKMCETDESKKDAAGAEAVGGGLKWLQGLTLK